MSLTKQILCYHQSPDVASAFSDMLYVKEHPEAKYSKPPGAAKNVHCQTSGAIVPEAAREDDGEMSASQGNAAEVKIVSLISKYTTVEHDITYASYLESLATS